MSETTNSVRDLIRNQLIEYSSETINYEEIKSVLSIATNSDEDVIGLLIFSF